MSSESKNASHVVREAVAGIKAKAGAVVDKMNRNVAELHQALDMADELANGFGSDARELRDLLAVNTNNPPPDGDSNPLA